MLQFRRAESHETYEDALPRRKPTVDKDTEKNKGVGWGNPQELKKTPKVLVGKKKGKKGEAKTSFGKKPKATSQHGKKKKNPNPKIKFPFFL